MNTISNNGRRIRFCNRKCLCGAKAEVRISNSQANLNMLFFRCKSNSWNVFEWWSVEDDNVNYENEVNGISSSLRQDVSNNNVGFGEQVVDSKLNTKLEHSIRGLKSVVIMLTVCVLLLCSNDVVLLHSFWYW